MGNRAPVRRTIQHCSIYFQGVCPKNSARLPNLKQPCFLQVLAFASRATAPSNTTSQLAHFTEVAEQLGVPAPALRRPFTVLSAGERQRVSLAWAVALQPVVLLLDEPTSHLDADASSRFEHLIKRLGCAVVRFRSSLVLLCPCQSLVHNLEAYSCAVDLQIFPIRL